MEPGRQEYKGHVIEVRVRAAARAAAPEAGEAAPELLIDDEPVRYGRLPDGRYFLYEHAYDWRDDVTDLARALIDYRSRAGEIRRERRAGRGD